MSDPGYHLVRMLADVAARHPDLPATRVLRRPGDVASGWTIATYAQLHADVRRVASWLVGWGIEPGDRVAILSGNRPEWSVVDFAIMAAGAVVVPVHAVSTPDQVRHVLDDSGSRFAFAGTQADAGKLAGGSDLPASSVVTFDRVEGVTSLADVLADDPRHLDVVDARTAAGRASDLATIIYTSGTTGRPKGAMLTHSAYEAGQRAIDDCWDFTTDDHSLCFLPLSHGLEREWTFHVFHRACMNTYCTNPREVADLLVAARPTMLISVPMLYERVYAGAREKAGDGVGGRVFEWALHVGGQLQHAYRKGRVPSAWWRAQLALADRLVLRHIRDAVGGEKTLMVSGGAPLRREVEEFFSAAGILLGQGYGLTETGPMVTIYAPDRFKLGTVGFVLPNTQLRVGPDGELWVKGPTLMTGYWNDPEATAAMIDAEGWLHTGDVGYIDTDGFVVITDRLKDMIVTLGGKNVAPQAIEAIVLADPLFEYAVLLGDNRPFLTMLVQPSRPNLEQLGRDLALTWDSVSDLVRHPHVVEAVRQRVAALTAGLPKHEQVRQVTLLDDEISLDSGLVTPTLKVRRREVEARFGQLIDDMYERVRTSRRP